MTQPVKQKWISKGTWICTGHVPAPNIPSVQGFCWFCGAPRPEENPFGSVPPSRRSKTLSDPPTVRIKRRKEAKAEEKLVLPENPQGIRCAWPPCGKEARPGSKYCSRNCSNKFARSRYQKPPKPEELADVRIGLEEGRR